MLEKLVLVIPAVCVTFLTGVWNKAVSFCWLWCDARSAAAAVRKSKKKIQAGKLLTWEKVLLVSTKYFTLP